MSLFGFLQNSRYKSAPVHLYEVVYGIYSSSQMRMTDDEEQRTWAGQIYQPVQIKHDEIHASGTLDKSTLTMSAPHTNPLTDLFRHYPPSQTVYMTVYRGERDDPQQQYHAIWSGRVLSVNLEDYESKFTCEPLGTALQRPGLRRNYQHTCCHVLYGPSCKANKAAASVNTIALAAGGNTVLLPSGWNGALAQSKFVNGMIEWEDGDSNLVTRTVLRVEASGANTSLLLAGRASGLLDNLPVKVSLGCNHQLGDCVGVHSNAPNFGGQPWIPVENPIGAFSPFY